MRVKLLSNLQNNLRSQTMQDSSRCVVDCAYRNVRSAAGIHTLCRICLQLDEYCGFLKQVPLFAALNESETLAIAEHFEERRYSDGEAIISEGDPGSSMCGFDVHCLTGEMHKCAMYRFILKAGTAVATKKGYDFELEYQAGDFFGELALLTPNPRAASIQAVGSATALLVQRSQFMMLVSVLLRVCFCQLLSMHSTGR